MAKSKTKSFPYSLGYRPDIKDRRDLKMRFGDDFVAALPPSNPRFATGLPDIWDQGPRGACTAFGIIRCHNFAAAKAGMQYEKLSCLQLYYDERSDEGTITSDAGAMIRTGIKSLKNRGVGLDKFWPYVPSKFADKPPAESYKSGLDHQAVKFASVAPTLEQIKAALFVGYPVVCGFPCYESLSNPNVAKTGRVPFPKDNEAMVGGHAVALNGFWDDATQWIGFDNSWSENWGSGGKGFLPYRYFANGMVADCWIVYEVEGVLPTPAPDPPVPVPPIPTPLPPVPTPGRRTIMLAGDNINLSIDGKVIPV